MILLFRGREMCHIWSEQVKKGLFYLRQICLLPLFRSNSLGIQYYEVIEVAAVQRVGQLYEKSKLSLLSVSPNNRKLHCISASVVG